MTNVFHFVLLSLHLCLYNFPYDIFLSTKILEFYVNEISNTIVTRHTLSKVYFTFKLLVPYG